MYNAVYVCMYAYIHAYIYTHAYIHTHMYILYVRQVNAIITAMGIFFMSKHLSLSLSLFQMPCLCIRDAQC